MERRGSSSGSSERNDFLKSSSVKAETDLKNISGDGGRRHIAHKRAPKRDEGRMGRERERDRGGGGTVHFIGSIFHGAATRSSRTGQA